MAQDTEAPARGRGRGRVGTLDRGISWPVTSWPLSTLRHRRPSAAPLQLCCAQRPRNGSDLVPNQLHGLRPGAMESGLVWSLLLQLARLKEELLQALAQNMSRLNGPAMLLAQVPVRIRGIFDVRCAMDFVLSWQTLPEMVLISPGDRDKIRGRTTWRRGTRPTLDPSTASAVAAITSFG